METWVSSEWPLLNSDFDEGSIMADFDCEDFTYLTNPACSPNSSEFSNNPDEIMNDAWKQAFAKLKTLEKDQTDNKLDNKTLTLGTGLLGLTDEDDFHFETSSIIDPNNSDCEEEEEDIIDPNNDCPCCKQKFKYRYQLVSHLEKAHNRCSSCQYKFETTEDLRTHQRMECGKGDYRDDDNLSISGDEDVSTLNDLAEDPMISPSSIVPEKEKITIDTDRLQESAKSTFHFEQEDNKDKVWEEIFEFEERMRKNGGDLTFPLPPNPPNQPPSADGARKRYSPPRVTIKTEPDAYAHDPSFEFESSEKGASTAAVKPSKSPATPFKPNSLLKKRLRPTLATKIRGKYGKASLKPHNTSRATAQTNPATPATPPTPATAAPPSPQTPAPSTSQQPTVLKEDVVVETPPVAIKEETVEQEDLQGELTCEVCELTFEGVLEMETHSATHFVDNQNGCNCVVCDTFCATIELLNAHEKEKHSLFAYKCGDCSKVFNSQSAFKEHEKYHSGYKQCPACDKKFLNDDRLKRHRDYHCTSADSKCALCNISFASVEQLTKHKETHHGKSTYKCEKCGKCFDHKQTLAVHKMSHTGEDKPFKCKVCGKGFKTYWYYVVHEKCYCKHIDKNVRIHPTHSTIETSKKKFYQCKICCRVFPHISHLKVHNYIHTGERPYKCNSCGKGFTQKQNLKVHERVHTGEKPYICNSCGFGFKDLGNLRRHQYIHTGEKPHGCDVCGKRFTWVESLRRHKRTHLKQRPYQCKVCKREFVHHGHLRIHELVHKQDEKPFQCNICGKSFTMLSSLSIHEHIHLDRKPYPCDMCQRTFMTASALTTHKQSHVQRMANAYRQAYRDRFSF